MVAALLPHADPLHKVTIIPRGMALGVTMQLPSDDKHTYTRDFLESQIAIMAEGPDDTKVKTVVSELKAGLDKLITQRSDQNS